MAQRPAVLTLQTESPGDIGFLSLAGLAQKGDQGFPVG